MRAKANTANQSPINAKRFHKRSNEIAQLMKAFGHPARLMLAVTLFQKEHSVGELEAKLDLHQPSLSQQLGVLRLAGIVETRRESKQIFYRLTNDKAAMLIEALDGIYAKK